MLSYAVIMVVLFIAISIYMNDYYSDTIREKIIDNNINTLSRIRYENEANISTAINIGNQIGLSRISSRSNSTKNRGDPYR